MITDITKDMSLYTEEVFGPVASMYRAADINEAIEIANATTFGLGSNAWTNDEAEQQRFIDDIEAGQVFINGMTVSYPELGFGGIKRSATVASWRAWGSASSVTPRRSGWVNGPRRADAESH